MHIGAVLRDGLFSCKQLLPGLLVTALVAMSAAFLGSHYAGSMLLFALLLGLALHFVAEDQRCAPGIQFAASTVLRLGVALLGFRMTLEHLAALGWQTAWALLAAVALTMGLALLLARALGASDQLGLLVGGATAICGASAALAISSVLPKNEHRERDTTLTVVGVTSLSTIAMVLYPMLVKYLDLGPQAAGIFLGATIHDVAQVVGAGYSLSPQTGDAATITKLVRVALLMPVLIIISAAVRVRALGSPQHSSAKKTPLLPWFCVAFVAFMLVNSTGWVDVTLQSHASSLSQAFFVLAIAGVGLKTSLRELMRLGWRPVLLTVAVTLGLAAMASAYLTLLH